MSSSDRKYTKEHEWVMMEDDTAVVGVTEYAAHEMGDVVFLELPEPGAAITAGDPVGTIETVKSVEDLYTPLSGEVVEANEAVLDAPEMVNQQPLADGWLFKIKITEPSEFDALMDADEYQALIGG